MLNVAPRPEPVVDACATGFIMLQKDGETFLSLKNTGLYGQCVTGPPCLAIDDAGTCFPIADAVKALRKVKQ